MNQSHLLFSPAAERNKAPILSVLERILPDEGRVLELASGSGQHVVYLAQTLSRLAWQPTDLDEACVRSISVRLSQEACSNIHTPLRLDVSALPWPVSHVDAIVCINLIHISPWTVANALFTGAASVLKEDGLIFLYGPYSKQGQHTSASNEMFDQDLRARNQEWGVRDLDDVVSVASRHGFALEEVIPMPANNFSVIFRK